METERKRVLVVDDEKGLLKVIKLNLEETGRYNVMTLASAEDIVLHVHTFKPDVILLDVLMPAVSGLDACALLNSDPIGKKTPIIIVSALGADRDKLKAYKLGVVDYITKPIDITRLISTIEKALLGFK